MRLHCTAAALFFLSFSFLLLSVTGGNSVSAFSANGSSYSSYIDIGSEGSFGCSQRFINT